MSGPAKLHGCLVKVVWGHSAPGMFYLANPLIIVGIGAGVKVFSERGRLSKGRVRFPGQPPPGIQFTRARDKLR